MVTLQQLVLYLVNNCSLLLRQNYFRQGGLDFQQGGLDFRQGGQEIKKIGAKRAA